MADFDPGTIKDVADGLMAAASSLTDDRQEAMFRAATNRYYYACFMGIYRKCGLDGGDYSAYQHSVVARRLTGASGYDRMIGNALLALKKLRVNADYYLGLRHTEANAKMASARAGEILKHLDKLNPDSVL